MHLQNRSVLKRHAALVDQMAETLGIDLEEAVLRGDLPIADISDAVLSCTTCSNPDTCEGWQKAHKNVATQAPDFCRNSEMFLRLRKATAK